jgi:UDP-N-acetylenolpyruvoylglucosamine reductase
MNISYANSMQFGEGSKILENVLMSKYSTWRCGGRVKLFFQPKTKNDVSIFLKSYGECSQITWLGLGSNTLFLDDVVDTIIIATSPNLSEFRWTAPDTLYAECGVTCSRIAKEAAKKCWGGVEFLAGIPGVLGGALKMNAGAHGAEIWSFVSAVEVIDRKGTQFSIGAQEYSSSYRCIDGPELWFLGAWLKFNQRVSNGAEKIRALIEKRRLTQPTGNATCGSVFKNPEGGYAGQMIDECGLKGYRVGNAEISEVHANFIVNHGNASASEILELISVAIREVKKKFHVDLQVEICQVGTEGCRNDKVVSP